MSNESKHTPGPWRADTDYFGSLTVYPMYLGDEGYRGSICSLQDCEHIQGITKPECEANATLIAAAPELLEALKAVVSVADRKTDEFDLAHAAIAKAEGREPDR